MEPELQVTTLLRNYSLYSLNKIFGVRGRGQKHYERALDANGVESFSAYLKHNF